MARRRADGQEGFVITLEFILIMSILGIGLLVGIVAIRNALFVWWQKKQSHTVWVFDSTPPPTGPIILGPARDFDEHEAPRLFYIDRDIAWGPSGNTYNFRAFIGVRDDRFTTRHRIFYENSPDCGVNNQPTPADTPVACTPATCQACISPAGYEDYDNLGVGKVPVTVFDGGGNASSGVAEITEAGGVGYLYPMQGPGPSYGIGRDLDDASGLPGTLYRETTVGCQENLVRSRWTSQTVISGLPCETLPPGGTVTAAKCPAGADGGVTTIGAQCGNVPPADSRCVVSGTCVGSTGGPLGDNGDPCGYGGDCNTGNCNTSSYQCACPGFGDGTNANNWIDFGANCCPPGTTETAPGQCSIGDIDALREATPVQRAGANALSYLTPPFRINLPPDPSDFVTTAPGGFEGAPPSAVTGPYDPSQPIDFNVAPANGESGPP